MDGKHRRDDLPEAEIQFIRRIVIVAAFLLLAAVIWMLADVLLLIFGAVLLAEMLRAIADPIGGKLRVSDAVALPIAGLLILLVVGSGVYLFGTQMAAQMRQLFQDLPAATNAVLGALGLNNLQEIVTGTAIGNILATAYRWGTTLITLVTGILIIVFGGVYLAINPAHYRSGLLLLFPPRIQPEIAATVDNAGRALRLWLIGQLTAMLLVGVLTALGLWLIGLPSAFALGLILGLADFVPIIGPVVAMIPGLLIASTLGLEMVIWTFLVYLVVQQVESNLIVPLAVGSTVKIAPAVGLFAVLAMGVIFGPLGVLFAYPLAVVADVAVRQLYIRETLGEEVEVTGEEG